MTLEMNTQTGDRQDAVFQRIANFEHHFVGVSKMVPAGHSESFVGINAGARKSEARIAENILEPSKS